MLLVTSFQTLEKEEAQNSPVLNMIQVYHNKKSTDLMTERFADVRSTIDAPRNKLGFVSGDQNASQRHKSETQ
jgi:hypothetical protein